MASACVYLKIFIKRFQMKKISTVFLFFVFCLLSSYSSSLSQNEKSAKTGADNTPIERPKYKIPFKFPLEVYHVYRMTENTKIERTYSDSSKREINSEKTYYINMRASDLVKNGIQTLKVDIDSIRYFYKSPEATYEYSSTDEAVPPLSFKDYIHFSSLLSKQFQMKYSAYGEVIEISGEELSSKREVLVDERLGIKDQKLLEFYQERLSDNAFKFVCDILKNSSPQKQVAIDSTWNFEAPFIIDHKYYNANFTAKLSEVTPNYFKITSKCDTLYPMSKDYYIYDIKKDAEILQLNSKGSYKYDVKSSGAIDYIVAEFELKMKCKVNGEVFDQKITSKFIWDLQGRTKF